MRREFGKRNVGRSSPTTRAHPTHAPEQRAALDPTHLRQAVLAIVLTVTIVGGMFLLPMLGQCDGRRSAFGLDWCRLMQASVEGAVRGVATGRGAMSTGR